MRHAFLQQQLDRLNDRLGMEAVAQHAVLQDVGDGGDGHALMMRHEAAHHDIRRLVMNPGCGEIQRLVKAVAPLRAQARQSGKIPQRRLRIDHRRQTRGIGRDHPVLAKPAFQTQPRYAEIGVLIGHFQVAGIVAGFRNPPRHAQACGVSLLLCHDAAAGFVQHRPRRGAHHQ